MMIPNGEAQLVKPNRSEQLYINCPECGKEKFRVEFCGKDFQSAWYCQKCGVRFSIKKQGDGFLLQPLKQRKLKTLVTLESKGPVRLLVEGIDFTKEDGSPDVNLEHHRPCFEQTCPTNFMGNVLRVTDPADGDNDPHGIFAFVKIEPWRDIEEDDETFTDHSS